MLDTVIYLQYNRELHTGNPYHARWSLG